MWTILLFIFGCLLLAFGADRFVMASVAIAKKINLSPLVVGVLLIGFGSSFPELIVAAIAAAKGAPSMAIGNVVGSNIANLGLVSGLVLLIAPVTLSMRFIKREFPILLLMTFIVGAILWEGSLGVLDGLILLALMVFHFLFMFLFSRDDKALVNEFQDQASASKETRSWTSAIVWWFVGLVLLFVSSELIVQNATVMARWFGMSEFMIGLTVVAVGTSLPELAATALCAIRKQHDIAIGNIIGSNIFNLLAVLAMPALIAPTKLNLGLLHRDYPIMLGLTVLYWLLMLIKPRAHLGRVSGSILLAFYVGYILLLSF